MLILAVNCFRRASYCPLYRVVLYDRAVFMNQNIDVFLFYSHSYIETAGQNKLNIDFEKLFGVDFLNASLMFIGSDFQKTRYK